jgi:hypothetical protein
MLDMKDNYIWQIVEKVAGEYGLNPHVLDGGEYKPDQMKVLLKLWDACGDTPTPEQWEAYVRQKAIFFTDNL